MAYRLDAGKLGKARKTAQGFYEFDATLALSRVLKYRRADGKIQREYFPEDEAKNVESLASLESAPVTLRHPPEMVTPSNKRTYSIGHTRGAHYDEETKGIKAKVIIDDEEGIAAIEQGEAKECSSGYECRLDWTPGVSPDGEPYDCIQRDRKNNHSGLGPDNWARAGSRAQLHLDGGDDECVARLDGNGDAIPPAQELRTMKIHVDGLELDVTDVSAQAIKLAIEKRDDAVKRLTAERDAAQGKADALTKELAARTAELSDPARLDARVSARTALVAKFRAVCGAEAKADGKSDRDLMEAIVLADDPKAVLTGRSAEYVEARCDGVKTPDASALADVQRAANPIPRNDAADADGLQRAIAARVAYAKYAHNVGRAPLGSKES